MTEDTTAVAGKADLTISLVEAPAGHFTLAVADVLGKGGGNLKIRAGKKMKFRNATGSPCTLVFQEMAEAAEPDPVCDMSRWIFEDPENDEPVPAECGVTLPVGYTWKPTLKGGLDLAVKYTVALPESAGVAALDPVIIIRPV